jgi:hypothetical protein
MRKKAAETWQGSAARLCRPRLVFLPMGLDRISSTAFYKQVRWTGCPQFQPRVTLIRK